MFNDNIHSHTAALRATMAPFVNSLNMKYAATPLMSRQQFNMLLGEIQGFYRHHFPIQQAVYQNLSNQFHDGKIVDPELPDLNCVLLLLEIWKTLKSSNDQSLLLHFEETLLQIGSTCIQGISHRLAMDYVAIAASAGGQQ